MQSTERLLTRLRARLALVWAVEDLQRGLAAAAGVVLVGVVLAAFGLFAVTLGLSLAAGGVVLLVFPLVGILTRRPGSRELAALADERLQLRERLSTALWCRGGDGDLDPLVVQDAEITAAAVPGGAISGAVRPRLLRRPMIGAAAALLACAAMTFYQPAAEAKESPEQKALARKERDRVAEVARKLRKAAERIAEEARKEKETEIEEMALKVKATASNMVDKPPQRKPAMQKLNKLRDALRERTRALAGLDGMQDPGKLRKIDKQLGELMKNLASAEMGSLSKDLASLEEKLKGADGKTPPSPSELREMAKRMDALKRALEGLEEDQYASLRDQLEKLANAKTLDAIRKKLLEMAARMEKDGYAELMPEGENPFKLGELSQEELQQLLEQLEEMASMEDLARLIEGVRIEMAGGKKVRLRLGSGTCSGGGGQCELHGMRVGKGGDGQGKDGQGNGQGQGKGKGMGGPGQGKGGKAGFDEDLKTMTAPEMQGGKIDPDGEMHVTSFRGLPKPGEVTKEFRAAFERARGDAKAPLQSEQIPRRYREGIRRYFDGLGKDD